MNLLFMMKNMTNICKKSQITWLSGFHVKIFHLKMEMWWKIDGTFLIQTEEMYFKLYFTFLLKLLIYWENISFKFSPNARNLSSYTIPRIICGWYSMTHSWKNYWITERKYPWISLPFMWEIRILLQFLQLYSWNWWEFISPWERN